jgi:DNA-3-methyladenine glycosylase
LKARTVTRSFFEAPPEEVAPRLLGKILEHRTEVGVLAGRIVEVEAYLGPHHQPPDPAAHSFRGPTDRNRVLFGPAGHAYVYAIYGRYFCMNISCELEGRAGCVLLRALEPLIGLDAMARQRGILPGALRAADHGEYSLLPPKPQKQGRGVGGAALRAADYGEYFSLPSKPQKQERGVGGAPEACSGAHWNGINSRDLTSGPSRLCQALGLTRAGQNGADLVDENSALRVLEDGWQPERTVSTPRIGIKEAVDWPLRFAVAGHECVSGPKALRGAR